MDRTASEIISDLYGSGLTIDQQSWVAELAIVCSRYSAPKSGAERTQAWRDRNAVTGASQGDIYIDNIDNNNKPSVTQTSLKAQASEFYKRYPLKKEPANSEREYLKARKLASHEEIMAGVDRLIASKPDSKFLKYPARWLKSGCWADEYGSMNNTSIPAVGQPRRTYQEIKEEQRANAK